MVFLASKESQLINGQVLVAVRRPTHTLLGCCSHKLSFRPFNLYPCKYSTNLYGVGSRRVRVQDGGWTLVAGTVDTNQPDKIWFE